MELTTYHSPARLSVWRNSSLLFTPLARILRRRVITRNHISPPFLPPPLLHPSINTIISSMENWSCRTESNLPMAAYYWPKPDVRSNLAQSKKRYLVLYLIDSAAKGNNELYAAQYHRPVFDASRRGKKGRSSYCLLYTSPSPRDLSTSRMPSSA